MTNNCITSNDCLKIELFNLLGKRWTLHILYFISLGNKGFNELKRNIPQLSSKVLSQRLFELEQNGFILKNTLSEKPLRVNYILTKKTLNLIDILKNIN